MSVQQLPTTKIIIKKDSSILPTVAPEKNVIKEQYTPVYEERYVNKTGNIDVAELANIISSELMGKKMLVPQTKAVEVDIKREIAIGKIDKNAIQSEVINKKVETKVDKLKELRKR